MQFVHATAAGEPIYTTTHRDHSGHFITTSGTNWSNRWTYRVFIMDSRRDSITSPRNLQPIYTEPHFGPCHRRTARGPRNPVRARYRRGRPETGCESLFIGRDCVKSLRSSYTGLYPQTQTMYRNLCQFAGTWRDAVRARYRRGRPEAGYEPLFLAAFSFAATAAGEPAQVANPPCLLLSGGCEGEIQLVQQISKGLCTIWK